MAKQKPRPDDIFFPAISVLMLGIVFTGFAKSYFLVGMLGAKLPNTLVHIHGALFVSWVLVLVFQASLVSAHRIRLHMTVGTLGFVLPPVMVAVGVLVLFDSIRRNQVDIPPELLLFGDLLNLVLFIVLVCWGIVVRRDAASHKRFITLGTLALMGPAVDRWNFGVMVTLGVLLCLPLLVLVYDLWVLRRVHRSTAVGVAMITASFLAVLPLSKMAIWHQWVVWIRHN